MKAITRLAGVLGLSWLLGGNNPAVHEYQQREIKSRSRNNHAQKRKAFVVKVARNRRRNKVARASRALNRA